MEFLVTIQMILRAKEISRRENDLNAQLHLQQMLLDYINKESSQIWQTMNKIINTSLSLLNMIPKPIYEMLERITNELH